MPMIYENKASAVLLAPSHICAIEILPLYHPQYFPVPWNSPFGFSDENAGILVTVLWCAILYLCLYPGPSGRRIREKQWGSVCLRFSALHSGLLDFTLRVLRQQPHAFVQVLQPHSMRDGVKWHYSMSPGTRMTCYLFRYSSDQSQYINILLKNWTVVLKNAMA